MRGGGVQHETRLDFELGFGDQVIMSPCLTNNTEFTDMTDGLKSGNMNHVWYELYYDSVLIAVEREILYIKKS